MTAMAQPNPIAPTAPDWARLVPIERAVVMLATDDGSLRRRCRNELRGKGLAYYGTPPKGGHAKWFVHRDYDARLIGGPVGSLHAEPGLEGYTLAQQNAARHRRECVERFREARRAWPAEVSRWLPSLLADLAARFPAIRVSRCQLYRWDKLYARPADLEKLVDNRGRRKAGRQDAGRDSREAWDAFRDLYLHQNRPAVATCWRAVQDLAAANGWRWCGRKSCYAQLDGRIPPEVQAYHRDPAAWRQQLQPTIAQDPESWEAGQCWVGDHKQLDVWVRFGGSLIRPWLTTWMDWRTRRLCGWVLSDQPNSSTILAALRHGLLDPGNLGGPSHVWIDNGKDYDAWLFHGQTKAERRSRIKPALDEPNTLGIFRPLRIEPHFSLPFNPNGKSRQERWFRTLGEFCKLFETYAGESVATRPERLNKVLANPRLVPSFEAVRARLAARIAGYNADADHARADLSDEGGRLSPDQAMAQWCQTRRVMADPDALDLLLAHWHKPVTVGRNGITLTLAGSAVSYGQFEHALMPFKAKSKEDRRPVHVSYDPHDVRAVRVYDAEFRFVCNATMNRLGGLHACDAISVKHVAELNRDKATYRKALKHTAEHGLTTVLSREEQLAEVAARRRARPEPAEPTPPHSMQIVQTPVDGEGRVVKREQLREQLRAAAGAESQSPPAWRASAIDKLIELRRKEDAPRPAQERPRREWTDLNHQSRRCDGQ